MVGGSYPPGCAGEERLLIQLHPDCISHLLAVLMAIDGPPVFGSQQLGNMRRTFVSVAVMLAVSSVGAYLYTSAAILTAVKVRTALSTIRIGPPRDIGWRQGPAKSTSVGPGSS